MCGCLLSAPALGAWPATQACTLTGNQTSNPLLHRLVLNPLNHTSQGWFFLFILLILYIAFFFFWIFKQPCNPGLNPYYWIIIILHVVGFNLPTFCCVLFHKVWISALECFISALEEAALPSTVYFYIP